MAKKLTEAQQIAEIVKVLEANGMTVPASIASPKPKAAEEDEAPE
jgi:hypothetical protein